jgi:predicted flap endonuclease-1-like 5' DNA nuclease
VGELESQLRVAEEAIADLDAALAAAGGSDEAFSQMQAARDEARAEIAELRGRLAHHASTIEEREFTLDHLQTRLSAAERSAVDLEGRLVAAERRASVIPELQTDLERRNAEYLRMSERLGEFESEVEFGRARVRSLEADLGAAQEVAAVVPSLRAELDEAIAERKDLLKAVAGLEGDLETAQARADQLEVELAAIPKPPPTRDEAIAGMAEIAARTRGDTPVRDDDLKRIHGIGPKLEQTLKGLGITSFRQVANFEPDDIVIVSTAIGAFKGRIERDDWIAGAAEEHQKEYNEPA